ncbi:MAG: hypothetical protein Crog4KO_12020 [Crocinitomicaceae bacterium]
MAACNEDVAEHADYLFDRCATCSNHPSDFKKIDAGDTLHFSLPEEYGKIDPNIPPKLLDGLIYIKTLDDYLLEYKMDSSADSLFPKTAVKFPDIHMRIADYTILDNHKYHLTTHADTNFVYLFDAHSKKLVELMNDADTRWNAMPFIGLTMSEWKGKYIFPFIPMNDYNEGRYLSVYSKSFKHEKSMGFGRDYENTSFAPLFDTPIISELRENGTFYATYSSGEQVLKCKIKDDWTIVYLDSVCFPATYRHNDVLTIPKSGLADFELLRNAHSSEVYTIRLLESNDFVYRIVKLKQEEIDPETRRVRTMIDAPWMLDKFEKSTGQFYQRAFEALDFVHSCSFTRNSTEYFLTYESLENEVVSFVAF